MEYDRLDQLDKNRLITDLDGIVKEIERLKTTQFFGSDSLKPRIIGTKREFWEAPFTFTQYVLHHYTKFFAKTQANPYATIFAEVYAMDGSPLPWSSLYSYSLFRGRPALNDGKVEQTIIVQTLTIPFKVKLFLQASDDGYFQILDAAGLNILE